MSIQVPVTLVFRPLEESIIGLYQPTQTETWLTLPVPRSKTDNALLTNLRQLLEMGHIKSKDITSIAVFPGPASYMELRHHITTANTLAWTLSIPIFPLPASAALPHDIPFHSSESKRGIVIEPIYPHSL